jgi:MinD superfamily P-loop ATPase
LGVPFGVVVNRAQGEDAFIRPYAEKEGIALLASLPDDRRIARAYAEGKPILAALPEYGASFAELWRKIGEAA